VKAAHKQPGSRLVHIISALLWVLGAAVCCTSALRARLCAREQQHTPCCTASGSTACMRATCHLLDAEVLPEHGLGYSLDNAHEKPCLWVTLEVPDLPVVPIESTSAQLLQMCHRFEVCLPPLTTCSCTLFQSVIQQELCRDGMIHVHNCSWKSPM
jgi:hypothetical protein